MAAAARDDHAAARMSDEQLRAVEDDAMRDVVAMQRNVGLQSATDGEFRRTSWHMDFIYCTSSSPVTSAAGLATAANAVLRRAVARVADPASSRA